ncbi:hypothetical protein KC327_g2794 [Hortaea werneckii]|nr:hypothetical protein KC358_g403 [Hortaea werneckii]KAI6944949.1 hypothetical protein KC341_g427 [Hortaea werneckii]KAI6950152.1 hypothetical protein KC348_g842 [Hortaea werneckii]KAI6983276.1 hypothetical protein KC321_g168 [Hortaea werneckii]KAI7049940.1 hypothetical protein KC366_g1366 [Hortaea werneckii]
MTGAKASQHFPPKNQSSSPFNAASNTSNAPNAQESTVPSGVNRFRDLNYTWYKQGQGAVSGRSSLSGGIHSNATVLQNQNQNYSPAARTSDNDDRNNTARKLPHSLDCTAQRLADIEASTSGSMTAAEHGEGFVRPETSGSGFPDPTDTDASLSPPERVDSHGPSSRTPHNDTDVDAAGSGDKDSGEGVVDQAILGSFDNITAAESGEEVSDEAIVVQAMRGSFQSITQSFLPNKRKKLLLLKAVCEFRRQSEGHSDISAMVDGVSVSLRKTKEENLRRRFPVNAQKLDGIRDRVAQFTVPWGALAMACGSRKRKTSSASDTEEHGQPSKKKSRLSGATPIQEETPGEDDAEDDGRLGHTYADQIVILDNHLGNAPDKVRYSMSFYKNALVVSTDGSFSFSPASGHAGAGMAWPAPETDNEASSPDGMKWYGISWPLGKTSDGQPISTAYAERMAIRLALRMIKWKDMAAGKQNLVIQTDSQTCLHQIKDGLEGISRDDEVNDIVLYVDALRSQFGVKLIWVKGHHQCTGNRMADRFAHGGRVSSELGSPPITSLEHSTPPGEVRTYAAGLRQREWKRPTCDAGTQTEPLMDGAQGDGTEAAHVLQESSESATTTDGSLPYGGPYTTGTSTSTAPVANLPDEAPGPPTAQSTFHSTAQQTKLQNHVGATTEFARFSLADAVAQSSASRASRGSKNETSNKRSKHAPAGYDTLGLSAYD